VLLAEATYLLPVALLVGLGAFTGSSLLAASALIVYVLFKLRETLSLPASNHAMASIIQKYDETLAELNRQLAEVLPTNQRAKA